MTRGPLLRPTPVGEDLCGRTSPIDWDAHFGFAGPLELEIGAGGGHFALEYCRRNPHVRYVAFEWRRKYARELQAQADLRGLKNLRASEGDARVEIPRIFRPATLAAIHFQFPDPWWKRAHQKRGVLQPDFTRYLLTLLVPGGLFDLRTDVEDRAHQMLGRLEEAGFENPLGRGVFHPYDPEEVPSTRERRYLISGQPVFRARLRRPLL